MKAFLLKILSPAGWTVLGIFLFTIAMDVVLHSLGQATESQQLAFWSTHSTTIPYIWGMLAGHWFIGQRKIILSAWGYSFGPALLLIIFDLVWYFEKLPRTIWRFAPIYIFAGMICGALFWGQTDDESPLP